MPTLLSRSGWRFWLISPILAAATVGASFAVGWMARDFRRLPEIAATLAEAKIGAPDHEFGTEKCMPVKYAPTARQHCGCLRLVENYIFLQGVLEQ